MPINPFGSLATTCFALVFADNVGFCTYKILGLFRKEEPRQILIEEIAFHALSGIGFIFELSKENFRRANPIDSLSLFACVIYKIGCFITVWMSFKKNNQDNLSQRPIGEVSQTPATEGNLLQRLVEEHKAKLSPEGRDAYQKDIDDCDTGFIMHISHMVAEHFISFSTILTREETPSFMHVHLETIQEIHNTQKDLAKTEDQKSKPAKELKQKIKTLKDTIAIALIRQPDFIECLREAFWSHIQPSNSAPPPLRARVVGDPRQEWRPAPFPPFMHDLTIARNHQFQELLRNALLDVRLPPPRIPFPVLQILDLRSPLRPPPQLEPISWTPPPLPPFSPPDLSRIYRLR